MVVATGVMTQQSNQIVDVVVIARIIGAVIIVPILQVHVIWGDERFLFDHFLIFQPSKYYIYSI